MLSCKEVSELVSQSLDQPLPWSKRLAVRVHLMMCRMCARYERQLKFIRRAAREWAQRVEAGEQPPQPAELPAEAKDRIRQRLDPRRET